MISTSIGKNNESIMVLSGIKYSSKLTGCCVLILDSDWYLKYTNAYGKYLMPFENIRMLIRSMPMRFLKHHGLVNLRLIRKVLGWRDNLH